MFSKTLGSLASFSNSYNTSTFIVALCSLMYACLLTLSYINGVDGPFINSYPHITSDGYDLIFEGQALYERLFYGTQSFLPVLRQPVIVSLWFLDTLLSTNGSLLIACNILAYAGTLFLLRKYIFRFNDPLTATILIVAYAFIPFHELGFYALSEEIGIALGLVGFTLAAQRNSWRSLSSWLIVTFLIITLGGLTKTYALIPGLIVLGTQALSDIASKRGKALALNTLLCIGIASTHVGLIVWWRSLFEYDSTPKTFRYLQFTFDMADFYLDVYGFLCVYLLPILIALAMTPFLARKEEASEKDIWFGLTVWLIAITQLLLAFFYQYEDTRFIYLAMPYLFIGISYLLKKKLTLLPAVLLVIAPLYFATYSVLIASTRGVFGIRLSALTVAPGGSWLLRWRGQPLDYFELERQCGNRDVFCKELQPIKKNSGYRTVIIKSFVELQQKKASKKQKIR